MAHSPAPRFLRVRFLLIVLRRVFPDPRCRVFGFPGSAGAFAACGRLGIIARTWHSGLGSWLGLWLWLGSWVPGFGHRGIESREAVQAWTATLSWLLNFNVLELYTIFGWRISLLEIILPP